MADRYELVRFVASGGQGEIWAAEDRALRASVAVKLVRCSSSARAALACREIAVLRMLCLPGVVRLRDEGFDERRAFIVTDYVEGSPFPAAPVPCSWGAIHKLTLSLFETLARVHAVGVVHRDLKPENILVGDSGDLTLIDFGVSLLDSRDAEGERNQLLGTPLYMAPEQLRGGRVSPQTDLYAAGVLLFEALTGHLPHEVEAEGASSRPVRRRGFAAALRFEPPPPLASVVRDVPRIVCETIDQLLAVQPRDRPRSASEVLERLQGREPTREFVLPPLGSNAPLAAVKAADARRESVDIVGPRGSGRTYWLRRAAAYLEESGRRVLWTRTGPRPFSSLSRASAPSRRSRRSPWRPSPPAPSSSCASCFARGPS